jgi:subtilisin family serine protease
MLIIRLLNIFIPISCMVLMDNGINPFFAERIVRVAPEVVLSLIVEIKPNKLSQVAMELQSLGIIPEDYAFGKFILISVPSYLVDKIAKIEDVTVHYNMPMTIQSLPFLPQLPTLSITDPILGEVRLPEAVIPELRIFGFSPKLSVPIGRPDVKVIPTSVSKKVVVDVDTQLTGKGVLTAVIDTGLTPTHPQFIGRRVMLETTVPELPLDFQGHGQWCSAAVGGNPTNTHVGVTEGIAPKCDILHIKALSTAGFGSTFSIMKAMEIAYKRGAKVFSMSLGGEQQGSIFDDPLIKVVEALSKQGVIAVIAAGNSGPDKYTIGSPGAAPSAVTVGAWSITDEAISWFSSRG